METVNIARNEISAVAWYTGTFRLQALAEMCAEDISARLGLSRAMAHRSIASVTAAYRVQRRAQQRFQPHQSIRYDRHMLQSDAHAQTVILWTMIGWQRVAFVTDALFLDGWSCPSLIQLRGDWVVLLIVPGLDGKSLRAE